MSVTGKRLQPTIFELSHSGRGAASCPRPAGCPDRWRPAARDTARPAGAHEPEVVRHYVNLSQLNHASIPGFNPLGSCTMKYNPKIDDVGGADPRFRRLHPLAPDETAQGTLQVLWELEQALHRDQRHARRLAPPGRGRAGRADRILMIRAYPPGARRPAADEVPFRIHRMEPTARHDGRPSRRSQSRPPRTAEWTLPRFYGRVGPGGEP